MASSRRKPQRRGGGRKKSAASGRGGSTWLWGAALVALVGGIAAYDNSADLRRFAGRLTDGADRTAAARPSSSKEQRKPVTGTVAAARPAAPVPPRTVASIARDERRPGAPQRHDVLRTAAIGRPAPEGQTAPMPAAMKPDMPAASGNRHRTKFFLCGTAKQDDCVITADSFMLNGQKIRIAGIEVPDIRKPACEAERIKASDAKLRVRAFLDSGPFDVHAAHAGDEDSSGQKIRAISRNGVSLSDILVREGLARRPGSAGGWC
jgi:Micrococcal nuclease (thermonuclease) homologs